MKTRFNWTVFITLRRIGAEDKPYYGYEKGRNAENRKSGLSDFESSWPPTKYVNTYVKLLMNDFQPRVASRGLNRSQVSESGASAPNFLHRGSEPLH